MVFLLHCPGGLSMATVVQAYRSLVFEKNVLTSTILDTYIT